MPNDQSLSSIIKEVPQLLTTIYGDLAQPSVKAIGATIGTLLEYSTLWHLKLKLKNKKEKALLQKQLDQFKENVDLIEEDNLCEVNPQIGIPIFEKLAYTTNDDIADLFINLLTKASSITTINQAHPAFIQTIERLSVDEAKIINYLKDRDFIPFINLKLVLKNGEGEITLIQHATLIPYEVELTFPENTKLYTDNLQGLGIFNIPFGMYKNDQNIYNPIVERHQSGEL